ncbi:DUF305 domain-containing protein [Leifsonia sp. NPDC014704]|uniref:DUF305 domain-containing protein n=1 Tax=Leifsonia virtsii TaxID=3035915 RepID=A0ABT8J406_9MICO|nr:DUF305 domain-containing protein [Leifsonia virtsii]MDN4599327.1 DUF305 domain-containing protein [Leifsonia virtsii]
MKLKTIALASGVLATALVLAGCSGTPSGGHSGMEMGGSSTTATTASGHNDADISFAQNMVMHHKQAIEMSDMVLGKTGVNARVTDLAQKIKDAQQPEIDTMNGWLQSWGGSGSMSGHDMGGMMSDSDMAALKDASGADAGKLFLTQMVQHHQGAINMANQEVKTGKNTDAVALAKKIVTDQTAEIATMQSLLASL